MYLSFFTSISRPMRSRNNTNPMWEMVSMSFRLKIKPKPIFDPIITTAPSIDASRSALQLSAWNYTIARDSINYG